MRIFKCRKCGNIVCLMDDRGGKLSCCGEEMLELKANTVDAAVEKHVPLIAEDGNIITDLKKYKRKERKYPKELYDMLGTDEDRRDAAIQFKDIKSNFKIAILVDMWLTGFDVPFLDTIYIDKLLKQEHSIIQTISRVNRAYPGKNSGLIVDFIGIKYGNDAAVSVDRFLYPIEKSLPDALFHRDMIGICSYQCPVFSGR